VVMPKPLSYLFRRRLLLIPLLLLALFVYCVPWSLPDGLDLGNLHSLSRANIAYLIPKSPFGSWSKDEPDEIWGLLHFVTAGDNRMLSHSIGVHPDEPMPMSVYLSEKDGDWESIERRFEGMPLVVFSKTYCPFSRRAKALLASYNLSPAATIVEVDLRDDGDLIKHILTRLTGRGTFPNAILNGVSIGGSDDLHSLHAQGHLQETLENAGIHADGGRG